MRLARFSMVVVMAALAACTPSHTQQTATDIAQKSRLTDSVEIKRSTQRTLSRQAQLCLVSESANTDTGIALLRNMQVALSGYFLAVGVESQALDYAGALQQMPCPGANYLLYVQLLNVPCTADQPACENGVITDLLITVLNADNSGLSDRITMSFKRNWLGAAVNLQTDQRAAFEQLGQTLTGAR